MVEEVLYGILCSKRKKCSFVSFSWQSVVITFECTIGVMVTSAWRVEKCMEKREVVLWKARLEIVTWKPTKATNSKNLLPIKFHDSIRETTTTHTYNRTTQRWVSISASKNGNNDNPEDDRRAAQWCFWHLLRQWYPIVPLFNRNSKCLLRRGSKILRIVVINHQSQPEIRLSRRRLLIDWQMSLATPWQ